MQLVELCRIFGKPVKQRLPCCGPVLRMCNQVVMFDAKIMSRVPGLIQVKRARADQSVASPLGSLAEQAESYGSPFGAKTEQRRAALIGDRSQQCADPMPRCEERRACRSI